jgi:hypothetical protein
MTNTNHVNSLFDYLDKAVDALEKELKVDIRPTEKKEASDTTGGSWEKEEVEILNPFAEAQRVLGKVEAVADEIVHDEQKAAALLEVAKVHTEIGKQLLDSFDF